MYMCLDTQRLYYDETNNRRVNYGYTGVNTMNDMMYYITPSPGTTYYCWEDNSLWLWNNKWVSLYTDTSYPSAYVYDDNRNITDVYNGDQPYTVLDNNGLLKDGSVVIRDRNRIIKGKIYIEQSNDNMTISSFLGGGIRLLPNGKMDSEGEFLIGDNGKSYLRSEYHNRNNPMYVDYSEVPEEDPSAYPKDTHIYEVFHEGNLDVSAIKVITPQDIYSKLQDSSLPNPLDLNVRKISGYTVDEISLVGHTHTATEITDFNTSARTQALVQVNDVFSRMTGEGITISYQASTTSFKMTANPFTLTFTGGVSGSALINKLSDTTITLDVDGTRHIHQNYITRMDDLQDQIDAISSVDPQNYYNKNQIDNMITSIEATDTATANKPLKLNNQLILPATSQSTNSLANPIDITLQGAVTGNVNTDLTGNIVINTSASNIISNIPTEGKALLVDANGNLPGNASTATALNHNLGLVFTGEVSGSVTIDTSLNQNTVNLTLNPGSNIIQSSDLGVTVATLGQDGKLTPSQLPATQVGLVPMGNWDPTQGAPSNNPIEGQFWIANTEGTFNNKLFQVNDWCLYYDSVWNKVDTNDNVLSVNGNTGNIILNASDVNAISTNYLDYTVGNTIPQNKIVVTSQNGIIEGASVSNLTSSFSLGSTNGDVEINTATSRNLNTNGLSNLDITLDITQDGYDNIFNTIGYEIYSKGIRQNYKHILDFGQGINISESNDKLNFTIDTGLPFEVLRYYNNMDSGATQDFITMLSNYINNRSTKPIYIFAQNASNNNFNIYCIDGKLNNPSSNNLVWNIQGLYEDWNHNNEDTPIVSLDHTNYIFTINWIEDPDNLGTYIIDSVGESTNIITGASYLNAGNYNSGTYIPLNDYNPATKKYVDDRTISTYTTTLGDNINTTFTVTHNLGSQNLIVQFRDSTTGEQLTIDNSIIDDDTISVTTTTVFNINGLQVFILKI